MKHRNIRYHELYVLRRGQRKVCHLAFTVMFLSRMSEKMKIKMKSGQNE